MSIQTEITRLQTAKGDMKTAIEGKGVTVPSAALVDDYPEYISQIGGAVDLSHRDVFGKITVAQNTANSYVVKTAGTYKIPLVYGNGIKNSAVNAAAYTRQGSTYTADFVNHLGNTLTSPYIEANAGCTPASVGLLWQTTTGMITSVSLVDGFKCKYLQFTVASVPTINGLAVLWVKDGNGDIMWSWTIWCTTDNLATYKLTNHTDVEYEMLGLPFGAIWNSVRERYTLPYYQWGRKDAMPPAQITSDQMMQLFDIDGNTYIGFAAYGTTDDSDAGGTVRSIANSIKNPNKFFTRYSSSGSWNNLTYTNNHWNAYITTSANRADDQNMAIKTIYDPMPVGFMIPGARVFTGFTTTGSNEYNRSLFNIIGSFNYGYTFKKNSADTTGVFFPVEGRITISGSYYGVSSEVYYTTYAPISSINNSLMYFMNGYIYPITSDKKANGYVAWPTKELT